MINDLSEEIEACIPFLRRYARAMTGSRQRGDSLAEATLVSILSTTNSWDNLSPRIALFRSLQDAWDQDRAHLFEDLSETEAMAQAHLSKLTPGSREALLLRAFEDFSDLEIGEIMRTPAGRAAELVRIARMDLAKAMAGRVLVIEDEPTIAEDIENIVTSMGHSVIGAAPTHQEAVRMAQVDEPDLILSDIQLAKDTSGLAAVTEILQGYPSKPVVYVTGYPEELLRGVETEPAFLVTKPYSVDQVRSAVSQAMFFSPRR